jgi:hypothetical protein
MALQDLKNQMNQIAYQKDYEQESGYSGDQYDQAVQQPLSLQEQKDQLKRKLMDLKLGGGDGKGKGEGGRENRMPPDLGKV